MSKKEKFDIARMVIGVVILGVLLPLHFVIGENKLGCFHNDFDELENAYAILHISCGKKVYFDLLTNDKGEEAIHFRMKGAPQKSIINAAKEFHDETEGANINADIMKLYKHI